MKMTLNFDSDSDFFFRQLRRINYTLFIFKGIVGTSLHYSLLKPFKVHRHCWYQQYST